MLQEGDLWVVKSDTKGTIHWQVRIWKNNLWRPYDHWHIGQLHDHCENDNLIQIESRPKLATYTGIYRKDIHN